MVKKMCFSLFVFVLIGTSCAKNVSKLGTKKYPTLDQALTRVVTSMKSKVKRGSFVVLASDKRKVSQDIAEKLALKMVELGSPEMKIVERRDLDKALEELELQATDTFDEEQTVKIGKFVGAKYAVFTRIFPRHSLKVRLYNEELQRSLPYIKVDLWVKVIELKTTKAVFAKTTCFWFPLPRKSLRNYPRRRHIR